MLYFASYFKGRNIGNDAFPNALSEFNSWFLKEAARSALTGYKIVEAFYSLQLSGVNWVVTVNDIATNGANPADLAPLLLKLPMASGGKYRIITRSGKVLSEISREDVRVLSAMHFSEAVLSATTGRYGGKVIPNSVLAKWAITVEQKARAQGRSLVIVPHATAAQLRGNRALHHVENGVEYISWGRTRPVTRLFTSACIPIITTSIRECSSGSTGRAVPRLGSSASSSFMTSSGSITGTC